MAPLSLLLFFSLLLFQLAMSDVQQLLSFKAALPNPDVLPSWTHSGDPCNTFSGVSCAGDDVVAVDLDDTLLNVDFRHVASHLLSIKTIQTLSLRSANVTGSLSGAGKKCGFQLSSLDLSGNSIDGPVSDLVEACVGLKSLNLSRTGLSGRNVNVVSSGSGLETLDLSVNKIAGEGFLKWVFESFTGLRTLDLSGNLLAGAVPVFSNCSSLQFLDLSTNSLTSTASDGLFASCEELRFLNLSSNSISGEAPKKMFGACRSLLRLDLSFNNFSGNLPEDLSACTSLESISLSSNNFSGILPVDVLTAMGNLKNLEFAYNHLAGPLPVVLFEKLLNLQVVDLSSNLLSGSIPADICKSSSSAGLKELYLQNNLFRGHIPPSIGECRKLVCLDLSFNYLTGTIPDSVGGLSRLRDLHMWQNSLEGGIPPALNNITTLENLILDNNGLSGPIPDLRNCSNLNWISLASNRLTGPIPHWIGLLPNLAILKMGNNSLSGPIPSEIGDCKSLVWLDLNSNHLNGTIPHTIAKQSGKIAVGLVKGKRYVYLRNDGSSECHGSGNLLEFAGIRQEQLDRIPTRQSCNFTRVYMGSTEYTFNNNGSMLFVDLSYNQLEGEIPKEFGDMYYISILNLGHNALTGPIPREFGRLKFLGILDLSHNFINGSIPTSFATCAMLAEMDLSYNNLSGQIPDVGQLATFPPFRYANNPDLCGFPLPLCGANSTLDGSGRPKSHRRQASLAGSIAMGLLFALFCIFALIIIAIESKKRRRKKKENAANDVPAGRDVFFDSHWNSGVVGNSAWKLTSTREAMSINLAAFENPLRKLTFADLLEATNGFHDDSLIGSGGFGDVYKAQLKDGSVVAIKKLIHVSGQGDREFTAEMETIGKIKHRNLVPLLGYCKVGEERLLVYEYMKYGSLDDVLHNRRKGGVKLNWATRRKIAVGAARGLAFLHHNCIPHIIHRDMKSSNVLLDESLEARVSDFGMARLMSAVDTHLSVSTLAGTPGYVPPEYYQSFRCSAKGDVYSYGVVLLELLTGRQPTDSADFGDNNLVGWVKQHSKLRITDVFDPELLKEDPGLELELLEHLKIACSCLDDRPLRRPTMLKVMAMFKEIQAGSMVDSATTVTTGSVDGMVEMSLKECKEEKELEV